MIKIRFSLIFLLISLFATIFALVGVQNERNLLMQELERTRNQFTATELALEQAENLLLVQTHSQDVEYALIEDLDLLARIIYSEAGNQSEEGQIAVGNVILNRVQSSLFPNSIKEVIYQENQFSSVDNHYFTGEIPIECYESALKSFYTDAVPETVLFFKADYCDTEWGYKFYDIIGNHLFYTL